jgi:hypothetical protein
MFPESIHYAKSAAAAPPRCCRNSSTGWPALHGVGKEQPYSKRGDITHVRLAAFAAFEPAAEALERVVVGVDGARALALGTQLSVVETDIAGERLCRRSGMSIGGRYL